MIRTHLVAWRRNLPRNISTAKYGEAVRLLPVEDRVAARALYSSPSEFTDLVILLAVSYLDHPDFRDHADPAGDAKHAAHADNPTRTIAECSAINAALADHANELSRRLNEQYETDLDDMARRADMMGYND